MSWLSWMNGRGPLRVQIDYTFSEMNSDNHFTVTNNLTKKKLRFHPKMADEATGTAYFEFLTPDIGNDTYEIQIFEKGSDSYVDVVRPEDLPVGPITALLQCIFELTRPDGELE
jgi:hypothetical protein